MKYKHKLICTLLILLSCFLLSCNSAKKEEENQNTFKTLIQLPHNGLENYMDQFYKEDFIACQLWQRHSILRNLNQPFDEVVQTLGHSTRLIDYPSFMDDSGFITTFKENPKNVAVLFSSYAEIWQLAGGTVNITVAETVTRNLVKEEDVSIVGTGSGKEINYELLLSYRPDLVIMTADYESQLELADRLRMFDIPVLVLRMDSFFDYLKILSQFTEILNTDDFYQRYGSDVLTQVESIIHQVDAIPEKPSVLFLRAYSYGAKAKTTNHFVGQMLKDLGAINIAEVRDFPMDTLSQEVIATSDVDYIFISVMGEDEAAVRKYVERELLVQPAFSSLNAVRQKKYYILPKDMFSFKPNQRWGEAYRYLAKLLYPQLLETY